MKFNLQSYRLLSRITFHRSVYLFLARSLALREPKGYEATSEIKALSPTSRGLIELVCINFEIAGLL